MHIRIICFILAAAGAGSNDNQITPVRDQVAVSSDSTEKLVDEMRVKLILGLQKPATLSTLSSLPIIP